jgi:Tol biopolymer transport system component
LNIFVIDVATRDITQLTYDRELVFERLDGGLNPSWSPDGETIVFDYSVGGVDGIDPDVRLVTVRADGTGTSSVFLGSG